MEHPWSKAWWGRMHEEPGFAPFGLFVSTIGTLAVAAWALILANWVYRFAWGQP